MLKLRQLIFAIFIAIPIFLGGFYTYLYILDKVGEIAVNENPIIYLSSNLIIPILSLIISKLFRLKWLYSASLFAIVWSIFLVLLGWFVSSWNFL